jgi:hypothetical protein
MPPIARQRSVARSQSRGGGLKCPSVGAPSGLSANTNSSTPSADVNTPLARHYHPRLPHRSIAFPRGGRNLPTVRISDIAGTRAGKAAIAVEMKRLAILSRYQITVCPYIVVPAAAVEMRGEQGVERHILAG